eukprot:TRINITY_DN8984_c0_g1_i7.p1 TRINITY_DN8984_c0_g1~~TRINITY_DN8984_c0_g1_i7.p1  ORF type:complete len:769 (+),score=161.07 TRINITY_DN8984_c0_g1_i7:65-2371(+)
MTSCANVQPSQTLIKELKNGGAAGCQKAMRSLQQASDEQRDQFVQAGVLDHLFKAMSDHASEAEVQDAACSALWNLSAGSVEQREKLLQAGVLDHLFKAMSAHASKAEVQRAACYALFNLAGSSEQNEKLLQAGVLNHLFKAMSDHASEAGVQDAACYALRNLLAGSSEHKEKLLQAGVLDHLFKAMSDHASEAGVQDAACGALWNLSADSSEHKEKLLQSGALPKLISALRAESCVDACRRSCFSVLLSLISYDHWGCLASLKGPEVPQLLLQTAAKHEDVFADGAQILAHVDAGDLNLALEQSGFDGQLCQVVDAAKTFRYTWWSGVLDTLLPLFDVGSDVAGLCVFVRDGEYKWLALQGMALLFNSIASAADAAESGEYTVAALNLLTLGTAGQLSDAVRAASTGVKTSNILSYKMNEGVEAFVSLGVVADVLAVSGILDGYPPLSRNSAALRWVSLVSSLGSLTKLAYDMDVNSIIKRSLHRHQRLHLGQTASQVLLVLYHATSVGSWLVLVFVALAFPAYGLPALAALSVLALFACFSWCMQSLEGQWVAEIKEEEESVNCNITSSSVVFDVGVTFDFQQTAAGGHFTSSDGNVKVQLEACGDAMVWTAGQWIDQQRQLESYWSHGARLLRTETASAFKAIPGSGCCSGMLRGALFTLKFGPAAMALNILAVSSNLGFLQTLAATKPLIWACAWITAAFGFCRDGNCMQKFSSPHVVALAAVSLCCTLTYVICWALLYRAGRWKYAADVARETGESSEPLLNV